MSDVDTTTPTNPELDRLLHSLTNHAPKDGTVVERFETLRDYAKAYGAKVLEHAPPSRERSLAITKLEESVMWAIKAIAVNQ